MIVLQIILFLSVACLFHSYVLFPFILKVISKNKKQQYLSYDNINEMPTVSILMAAYNEEAVIEKKIESILTNEYPKDKLKILIGSDNSTDKTNAICQTFAENHLNIHFTNFTERQGKISIINQLQEKAQGDILILTDANVMFDNNTIYELVKYFKDPNIGLVDSKMTNTGLRKEGISIQEKSYISREVFIKHREGLNWGSMMGPFGGCYAIKKELYTKVPSTYLVDDFFINMKIIEQDKKCINNLDAIVFEDVSNNLKDEFRRKIRIATGNFQNLKHFKHLLFPPWKPIGFSFLSHKVLRWLGPFFLLAILISVILLSFYNYFYLALMILTLLVFLLPFVDYILKKLNIHNIILRFSTHFFTMNISLFLGFIKFIKGVNTNVWKPTKRFQ